VGESPSFKRLLRDNRQGENLCRLLIHSGGQGKNLSGLTPSSHGGRVPIFQKTPRGIATKVKTYVGGQGKNMSRLTSSSHGRRVPIFQKLSEGEPSR